MRCLPLLVVLLVTIIPTKPSFTQTQTATPATEIDSKKAASSTTTTTKKPKKTKNTAKADKPVTKLPTAPGEEAAYELSGHKGAPEGSSPPK
jgi:hypothetical protein